MKSTLKKIVITITIFIIAIIGIDMYKAQKKVWFEGSDEINCTINSVSVSTNDLGAFFVEVIKKMPSMANVELVEQGEDFVTIKTNEGLMKRTGITKQIANDRIIIEYDEVYQASNAVTATSHYLDEFEANNDKVTHRMTISNLKAPGFLGFFYRNFGSSNMGKAFLNANKSALEK